MERPVVFSWFPFLLFMWLKSTSAQNEPVYVKLGGTINLKCESCGTFYITFYKTDIVWKHNGRLVAEWVNNEMDYYGMFVGRTKLDIFTGGLEIKNTGESFAGLYTVEISEPQTNVIMELYKQVQRKGYTVKVIKEVTTPMVDVRSLACLIEQETCRLVCLHNETSAFGPLTYSWREDDGDWRQGGKEKPINNDEKTKGIESFSCRVKNPVSEAESEAYNPFYYLILDKPIWPTALYLALKVLVVMTFLGLSGYFMWRKREILKKLMCPRQDREKKVKYEGPCTVYVL